MENRTCIGCGHHAVHDNLTTYLFYNWTLVPSITSTRFACPPPQSLAAADLCCVQDRGLFCFQVPHPASVFLRLSWCTDRNALLVRPYCWPWQEFLLLMAE